MPPLSRGATRSRSSKPRTCRGLVLIGAAFVSLNCLTMLLLWRSSAGPASEARQRSLAGGSLSADAAAAAQDLPVRVTTQGSAAALAEGGAVPAGAGGGAKRRAPPRRKRRRRAPHARTFHLVAGTPPRIAWNASDDTFLRHLEGEWDVTPYSSQPGVFLLQQPGDYACVLLIQDACYLYMVGTTPLHSQYTGVWFSEDRARDLSRISLAKDACTLYRDIALEEQQQEVEGAGGGADGDDGDGDGGSVLEGEGVVSRPADDVVAGGGTGSGVGGGGAGQRAVGLGLAAVAATAGQLRRTLLSRGALRHSRGGGAGGHDGGRGGGGGGGGRWDRVRETEAEAEAEVGRGGGEAEEERQGAGGGRGARRANRGLAARAAADGGATVTGMAVEAATAGRGGSDTTGGGHGDAAYDSRSTSTSGSGGGVGGVGGGRGGEGGQGGGGRSGELDSYVQVGGADKVGVTAAAAADDAYGERGGEDEGSSERGGGSARGFLDEFDEDIHDLTDLRRRNKRVYGRFVSAEAVAAYVNGSSHTSRKKLRLRQAAAAAAAEAAAAGAGLGGAVAGAGTGWGTGAANVAGAGAGAGGGTGAGLRAGVPLEVGVVPRFGSYMGNFGEAVVALMEAAGHLVRGPYQRAAAAGGGRATGGGRAAERGRDMALFFPGDKEVRSSWTAGIGKLLLGPESISLAGHVQGRQVCFKNALFVVNKLHTERSADSLRARAAQALAVAQADPGLSQQLLSPPVVKVVPQRVPKPRLLDFEVAVPDDATSAASASATSAASQDGGGDHTSSSSLKKAINDASLQHARASGAAEEAGGGGGSRGRYQMTIIEREGQRTVTNVPQLAALLKAIIPELPVEVVRLTNASLLAQVELMQRTVLVLGMHGASLSNIVFMPRGGVVIETLPFKYFSLQFKKIALRSGLQYMSWANSHARNSGSVDGCMERGGFAKLEEEACWKIRECVFCVRDRSVTHVHAREIAEVMRNARIMVRHWMELRRIWPQKDAT